MRRPDAILALFARARRRRSLVVAWVVTASLIVPGCSQIAWVAVTSPGAVGAALTREYSQVEFVVIDGESSQPITGANVDVSYSGFYRPDNAHARTDAW